MRWFARLMFPYGQRGAGFNDFNVIQLGTGWLHAVKRGESGKPQLPTMPVGHLCVANILITRSEFATGAQQKKRWCARGVLDCFTHGADVIRRDRGVLPGQGRRVTSIINKRRPNSSGRVS